MNLAIHYVGQAISGTGQQGEANLDIEKLQEWLENFAKIIKGTDCEKWLEDLELSTQADIEEVVKNIHGYRKELNAPKQNWYALLVCIIRNCSIDKSLLAMKV